MVRLAGVGLVAALLALLASPAASQSRSADYQPPMHTDPSWPVFENIGPEEVSARADAGAQLERDRSPQWDLSEHRKLDRALATLQPQRKGVVDAYVVSIALDSDPVFGREAREAAKVLARRYDAAGRTIVLAGTDGVHESDLPQGSPDTLAMALARVRELMDPNEDVLVLYTTGHGAPFGLAYHDGDQGYGAISPYRLWRMLGDLGIKRDLLMLSACFSGTFVPLLSTDDSIVITAASADRTSFGCRADNDWTFFGDAMINHALRKGQPLDKAFDEARGLVGDWEARGGITPSDPQISIGARAAAWLGPLEKRMPLATTASVGAPATVALAAQ
jgi:hypothetical protein